MRTFTPDAVIMSRVRDATNLGPPCGVSACAHPSGRSDEYLTSEDARPGEGGPAGHQGWCRKRRQWSARRSEGCFPGQGWRGEAWAKRLGITALVGFLVLVVGFFIAYATIDAPEPNDLVNAQTSIVYFADGKTEMARLSVDGGNRQSVQLKQVPKSVQQAHLAAEDRDFYQNSGISPTGIARGAWETLRGGGTQSGSTITQQYVKNYFLTSDQTLSRKGREIIISIKIGKQQSKDTILQNYLNTIYYGRGAYGIQTAARV